MHVALHVVQRQAVYGQLGIESSALSSEKGTTQP